MKILARAVAHLVILFAGLVSVEAQEPPLPTPESLIKKVADCYRSLETYHDKGTAKNNTEGAIQQFETYFSQKEGFKIEWVDSARAPWREFSVIWGKAECLKRYLIMADGTDYLEDCQSPQYEEPGGYVRVPQYLALHHFFGRPTPYVLSPKSARVEKSDSPQGEYLLIEEGADGGIQKSWIHPISYHLTRYSYRRRNSLRDDYEVEYTTLEINPPLPASAVSYELPLSAEYSPQRRPYVFLSVLGLAAFTSGTFFWGIVFWLTRDRMTNQIPWGYKTSLWKAVGILFLIATVGLVCILVFTIGGSSGHPPGVVYIGGLWLGFWVPTLVITATFLLSADVGYSVVTWILRKPQCPGVQ